MATGTRRTAHCACLVAVVGSLCATSDALSPLVTLGSLARHAPGGSCGMRRVAVARDMAGLDGDVREETALLRLRGGRDVPIDQAFFRWWDTSPWSWAIISVGILAAVYVQPLLPHLGQPLDKELKAEAKAAVIIMLASASLFAAGPAIENALGAWSMGFAPFAQTLATAAGALLLHVAFEYLGDARDAMLEKDAEDPNDAAAFAANYRVVG